MKRALPTKCRRFISTPAARDHRAERQAGQKRADDGFHAGELGGIGDQERRREDEHEFRDAVGCGPAEKPVADARQHENRAGDQGRQRQAQLRPERGADAAVLASDDDGQHQERGGVGQDGAADRRGDGAVAAQPQPLHDGKGNQRVRGEHAGQQDGLGPAEAQQPNGAQRAQHLRDQEGQRAEHEARLPVALEVVEIDFQPGEEHQVEQAHLAQLLERLVEAENSQPEFAHDDAGQDQARDVRQPQFDRQQRRHEQQHHHQREIQDEPIGSHVHILADMPVPGKRRRPVRRLR